MKIKQLNSPSLESPLPLCHLRKGRKNFGKAVLITILVNSFNILILPTPEAGAGAMAEHFTPVDQNSVLPEDLPDLDITQGLLPWESGAESQTPAANVPLGEDLPDLDITQNLVLGDN